tara:strand:+ start:3377 stop:4585 length:1209 start_codon:yes stop_codon:yes gene_type:complete
LKTKDLKELPDGYGNFGVWGGMYLPETLMPAVRELDESYRYIRRDPEFKKRLGDLLTHYAGRPTPLYFASGLTEHAGGGQIYLKREDLAHTGAHKINAALGQGLLAQMMGKPRVIAETGAGQHGVATATVCSMLGLECAIYMGDLDVQRQQLNVFRMKVLGAEVVPVKTGSKTLKDAINEAIRDWVTNVRTTYYLLGSVAGPHPYPMIVRDFQRVIGEEIRLQMIERIGNLPDAVVACVGGGSNAIGAFFDFIQDEEVRLIGVEAAGCGVTSTRHAATLEKGKPGVLHGARTYVLQDDYGQIAEAHSISAGLDYPGVGPEHTNLREMGRAEYVSVTDDQALEALQLLAKTEGIIPALESAHAIYHAVKLASTMSRDDVVVANLSGRGDKDMGTVVKELDLHI